MEILTSNQEKVPTTLRWQEELKSAFRDVDSLLESVGLSRRDLPHLVEPEHNFPLLVPKAYAERIRRSDPADPLLAQVVATADNGRNSPDRSWSTDPVEDSTFEVRPGLLHKYAGRALLLVTGACAVHCRYCFRQNFDYSSTRESLEPALEYVKEQKSISELILSGGDPLMRTDGYLADLIHRVDQIEHLKRLRIHTRTPVVLPSRVTPELLDILSKTRLAVSMVLHMNHAQELDSSVRAMISQLRSRQLLVLNQAVLLKGINSDFESQFQLCESLINEGVIPYYLHLLDRVKGAESYLVSDHEGIDLVERLRSQLPGYAVPKLVREIVGKPSKTAVR